MVKRKIDLMIGLWLILALLTFGGLVAWGLVNSDTFRKQITFNLASSTGTNLSEGMDLIYSGFPIGKIIALELTRNGMVQLTASVPEKEMYWIRKGSEFTLQSNLLGNASIIVTTPDLKAPPFISAENQVIATLKRPESIQESLEPILKNQVEPILKNINVLTARLASDNPQNSLAAILGNITQITQKIASEGDALNLLIAPDSKGVTVGAKVHGMLDDTQIMTRELAGEMQNKEGILFQIRELLQTLVGTLDQVAPVLKNVEGMTGNVAGATGELGAIREQVDDLLLQINDMLAKANRFLPGDTPVGGGFEHP